MGSTSLKTKLRTRLDTLQKKSIDMKKQIISNTINTYIQELKKSIEDKNDKKYFVFVLNDNNNIIDSKSIPKIINPIKGLYPSLSFLGIVKNNDRLLCFTNVPKETQSVLNAKDWLNDTVLKVLNGKGGGKIGMAQGQVVLDNNNKIIDDDDYLENVITIANDYALEKIGGV